MKPTIQSKIKRLKSRSEQPLSTTNGVVPHSKRPAIPQLSLRFDRTKTALRQSLHYRLRVGDFVLFNGRICPVIRVSDCAAVISVARPRREFTTLFGKCVSLRPTPQLVRISANSEIPILNRKTN